MLKMTSAAVLTSMGLLVLVTFASLAHGGEAHDVISKMLPANRDAIFQGVVKSGGNQCGEVTRVFYKGENVSDNSDYYAVRCDPGGDWVISIENVGNKGMRLVSCGVLKAVGVSCWDPI